MRTAYGLLVWFIATLFVIYAFCLNTAAAVFSHAIKTTLQITDLQVSYATGSFIAGFALMQIPAGYFLDRFNVKWVISFGVLLLTLGNVFISYADGLTLFMFSNFIQGIGGSFAFIAAAVLISNWFPSRLFPIMFGLTQMLSCVLAGILHYIFMTALVSHLWSILYKYLALYGGVLLVLTMLIVDSPSSKGIVKHLSLRTAFKQVCCNTQLWLCTLAAATSFGVLLAYASFWYVNIQQFYTVPTSTSFILSAIIFLGIGLGTPFWGYLSNVFKSRKLIIHITLVLGTMALMLGIYLPHYNFNGLFLINVISFFIGFFLSGSMLFYTIVNEISTDYNRGLALSITNTCVFLFNTFLMFLPYLFITRLSQNFFTYLWILPFSVLISILFIYFIKDSYR